MNIMNVKDWTDLVAKSVGAKQYSVYEHCEGVRIEYTHSIPLQIRIIPNDSSSVLVQYYIGTDLKFTKYERVYQTVVSKSSDDSDKMNSILEYANTYITSTSEYNDIINKAERKLMESCILVLPDVRKTMDPNSWIDSFHQALGYLRGTITDVDSNNINIKASGNGTNLEVAIDSKSVLSTIQVHNNGSALSVVVNYDSSETGLRFTINHEDVKSSRIDDILLNVVQYNVTRGLANATVNKLVRLMSKE